MDLFVPRWLSREVASLRSLESGGSCRGRGRSPALPGSVFRLRTPRNRLLSAWSPHAGQALVQPSTAVRGPEAQLPRRLCPRQSRAWASRAGPAVLAGAVEGKVQLEEGCLFQVGSPALSGTTPLLKSPLLWGRSAFMGVPFLAEPHT